VKTPLESGYFGDQLLIILTDVPAGKFTLGARTKSQPESGTRQRPLLAAAAGIQPAEACGNGSTQIRIPPWPTLCTVPVYETSGLSGESGTFLVQLRITYTSA
jgi:hypothetical protein